MKDKDYKEILTRTLREQPRGQDEEEEEEEADGEEEDGESGEEGEGLDGSSMGGSSTTQDPSIPENPVGLKDPSVLLGEYEEEQTIKQSQAYFK